MLHNSGALCREKAEMRPDVIAATRWLATTAESCSENEFIRVIPGCAKRRPGILEIYRCAIAHLRFDASLRPGMTMLRASWQFQNLNPTFDRASKT